MGSTSDPRDPKPPGLVTGIPVSGPTPSYPAAYPYSAPPTNAAPYYPNPNPNPHPNGNGYYPNPNPNYNGYYPNPNPNRQLFFRRFVAGVIAVFLTIAAITFIVWLILRPKLPVVSVSSFDVSNFNLSSPNSLSSEFNLNLTVRNPNSKMSIYYDQVAAGVLYSDELIAEASLPPFFQKTGNVTNLKAKLVAAGVYVNDDVVNGIRSERGSANGNGVVRFGVRVGAVVRFKDGAWRTRYRLLRVYCDDIGVGFKSATSTVGSMVGAPGNCQVGL